MRFQAKRLIGSVQLDSAVLSYRTRAVNATNLTTYTFTSQDVGVSSPTRVVVAAFFGHGSGVNPTVSGTPTLAGNNMTQAAEVHGPNETLSLYTYNLGIGAVTADLSVTFSTTVGRAGVYVWTINTRSPAAVSTASRVNLSGTAISPSSVLSVPQRGVGVVLGYYGGANEASSWNAGVTDAGSPTYLDVEGATVFAGGSITSPGDITPTLTYTTSTQLNGILAASWRP